MDAVAEKIDTAGIAALLGYSVRHVRDYVTKLPEFPAPSVNLSPKHRRWNKADVLGWSERVSQAA